MEVCLQSTFSREQRATFSQQYSFSTGLGCSEGNTSVWCCV